MGNWPAYCGAFCEGFYNSVSGIDLILEVSVRLKLWDVLTWIRLSMCRYVVGGRS